MLKKATKTPLDSSSFHYIKQIYKTKKMSPTFA